VNRRLLLAVATAVTVVGAALAMQRRSNHGGEGPSAVAPSPVSPAVVRAAAVEGNAAEPSFNLRIQAGSAVYRYGVPIQIRAWLTGTGPRAQEQLVASGSGLVLFTWEQQGGDLRQEALATAVCAPYSMNRGQALPAPFAKSGGFSADDPHAAFWKQYFADPALHLPAGRYRIHAQTDFYVGECGGLEHRLDAAIVVDVLR